MGKEMLIRGFEVGRGLTQDDFEEQDWNDLDELLAEFGIEY
jgi:hypothetical protein